NANPVTAIIGPRQSGKSTLAKKIIAERQSIYLDLERPSDLQKLEDPEWFLTSQKGKLICLDEIQRKPDIFPLIRSLVDEWGGYGHFLVLGSASRDLLRQSSESLAGRIGYKALNPLTWDEIKLSYSIEDYLVRGGFPRSLLANNLKSSLEWREDFTMTFLERDLLQWAGFSTKTMRNLWQMLAHLNGQVINYSKISKSLNVSNVTIKNYVNLLESTFMVSLLPPYLKNTGKRIVKNPKLYLTDTGISNALLRIHDFDQLSGHPGIGSTWETLVLTNLKSHFPELDYSFYRTSNGAEIDIIIEYGLKRIVVECKASPAPALTKGNYIAITDINPVKSFVVAPIQSGWPLKPNIEIVSISQLIQQLKDFFLIKE
ncbi:ATP-binding protein, partial [Draconibacterium sp.]|nr:ATP-binding protein [Draconibacterium sp.]